MKNLDNYIDDIASKVKGDLNIFYRILLYLIPDYSFHHFGLALYIRNNYTYDTPDISELHIDSDRLSESIFYKIINKKNYK